MRKRIISLALLLALALSGISQAAPASKEEQASPQETRPEEPQAARTPILGPPTVTVYQMKQWASQPRYQAHPEFVRLARTFYDISVAHGVDPAVTYAQAAKETNFFRFTGVLTLDFHNPCGLKITAGGSNSDPEAHQRFKDWPQGITAQVHHLALYAGQKGFPKAGTPDPRHFPSLRGQAPLVENLSNRWAPRATYGEEVVRYMDQMLDFPLSSVERIQGKNRYETAAKINQRVQASPKSLVLASGQSFADSLTATTLAKAREAKLYLVPKDQLTQEVHQALDQPGLEEVYLVGGPQTLGQTINRVLDQKNLAYQQIAGRDRYETALALARHLGRTSQAIVANGQDFADTLAISAYAVREGLPIYLTAREELPAAVLQELDHYDQVLLIGGPGSLSPGLESSLQARGLATERIQGADRYATSLKVAQRFYPRVQAQAFVSGQNFADALAAVALVDQEGGNILLTQGQIGEDLKAYLRAAKPSATYVIGGLESIPRDFDSRLKDRVYEENK